jgi:predicted nucleic acid-binding protein
MLLDTDVMVDFLRGYAPAVTWLTNYARPIGIPGLVAMELLQGCHDLAEQQRVERELKRFSGWRAQRVPLLAAEQAGFTMRHGTACRRSTSRFLTASSAQRAISVSRCAASSGTPI